MNVKLLNEGVLINDFDWSNLPNKKQELTNLNQNNLL